MSGESRPVPFITVGLPVEIDASWTRGGRRPARVAKIGRVWFMVRPVGSTQDFRFAISDLRPHPENSGYRLTTGEIADYLRRVDDAWALLKEHDLGPSGFGRPALHDEDLFAIAELLSKRAADGAS